MTTIQRRIFIIMLLILMLLPVFAKGTQPHSVEAQDGNVYTAGVFPRAMEFDGQRVWVANWLDNTITIMDAFDGQVLRTLSGRGVVAQRPVALQWDGTHMWVAHWQDNLIYRLNIAGQLEHTLGYNEGIQQPIDMLFDGAHVWIVNQGRGQVNGSVTKIVTRNLELLGNYEVGRFPTAITWDGEKIWVANGVDDSVTVLDSASGAYLGQIQVNNTPISIVYDGVNVWVGHYDGTILVINSRDMEIVNAFEERPGRPVTLHYAFERIWIANSDAASVTDIRAETGTEIATIESEGEFSGTLVATTNQVWVANWLDYTIKPIDVPDALEKTLNQPATVAADPQVWLPTLAPIPTVPTPTVTPIPPCDTPFDNRLVTGDRGRIEAEVNQIPLNLRSEPGREGEIVEAIRVGTEFDVTGPAVCVNSEGTGDEWWIPVVLDDGREGWFVEALKDDEESGGHYTVVAVEQEEIEATEEAQ